MTREEAIKEIIRAYDVLDFSCHMDNCRKESFNMAIRALKNEQTDGDLIPRQAVITMLNKIENAVEDGDGFQFNEWVEYAKDIPSSEKTAEWISVSERLPEESLNSVIGWDAYRERCVFVQYIDGCFQITGNNESFDIVAWMPLPEPYKEERKVIK